MTTLSIRKFSGQIPRLPSDRLPEDAASVAGNCDFSGGELAPIKALGTHYTVAASAQPCRALFTTDGVNFYAWSKPTRAYRHPTIDDTANRIIYHKHGEGLKVALASGMKAINLQPGEPTQSWSLGVKPTPAPVVTLGATTSGDLETVSVVAVAVNAWGEESSPSSPVIFDRKAGQSATYSVSHTPNAAQQTLAGINFYRTYSSAQGTTEYFLVNATPAALSGGTASISDASDTPQTSSTLVSTQWDQPPAVPSNLTYMGNGFFVVGTGKDLVFSEPYRPHAWAYRMAMPHAIVGIVEVEGGALVTTTVGAYLISGAHPSQVTQQLLPVEQAGWSDTAIARISGAAVYASNDGLVMVRGGQSSMEESQALFTRERWRALFGSSKKNIRLIHHDGKLIAIVDPNYPAFSASFGVFMIGLDSESGGYQLLSLDQLIYGAAVSSSTDQLFMTTATGFAEFAGSTSSLQYNWRSGDRLYPRPVSFACGVVDAVGAGEVFITCDGNEVGPIVFSGRTSFRLPPMSPGYRWMIDVYGDARVREISLAQSFSELQGI